MDIQEEREAFQKFCEENFDFERHEQTYFDEKTQCYENDIGEDTESINMAWSAWQAAKAQAVPEGFVLVKSSDRDREVLELIDQRDYMEDQAEQLKDKLQELYGVDFGEHSSCNLPFQNAIDFDDSDLVLVEKAKLMQIIGSVSMIEPITRGNPYMDSVQRELTAITDVVKTVIEAQKQKVTELKIEWASDCFNCGHHEAIIYSTASEAASKGWFHDGDKAKCCKCGHEGEIDARSEDSDICWYENEAQEQKG